MRSSVIGAAAIVGRALAQAPPTTDNPKGAIYQAVLPDEPFFSGAAIEGNIKGSITGASREDGKGVRFTIKFENLPAEGGPFTYHIHKAPVTDGNCTSTLSHLDPYGAGAEVPCNPEAPETCEVGDLAGKHGKIDSDPFTAHYSDYFASTNPDDVAFFGNLSFVIHFANSTRITCANFERKVKAPGPDPTHEPDCDAPGVTPAPMPTPVEEVPPVDTAVAPCNKCEGKPEEEKPPMAKPDEGNPPQDQPQQGGEGGEQEEQPIPPPKGGPVDSIVPVPTPTDDSDLPVVTAGASMTTFSLSVLSVGVAFAALMSS
ncbi:copper/zinc superoxide dismutase (SODC) domain-containing protein [Sarocladium implicatum]|nr:copper/zinc superoxide dismutase (SODC) domain-containing protein [Sarocladium implicatum]